MLKKINRKSLNTFTVCVSMITFTLLWWCAAVSPISPLDDGTFARFGLTILLILLSKYFDKDLEIKLSEMYFKLDIKNLIYSFIGVFIYLYFFRA